MSALYGAFREKALEHKINKIQEFIDSPKTNKQLREQERLLVVKDQTNNYYTIVSNAHDAFDSKPVFDGTQYETLESTMLDVMDKCEIKTAKVVFSGYSDGAFSIDFTCDETEKDDKFTQELPSQLIDAILEIKMSKTDDRPMFTSASYVGYEVNEPEKNEEQVTDENGNVVTVTSDSDELSQVTFTIDVTMNGRNSAVPSTEESTTKAAE